MRCDCSGEVCRPEVFPSCAIDAISLTEQYFLVFLRGRENWWDFGIFCVEFLFCCFLSWHFCFRIFPIIFPAQPNLPEQIGRKASVKGSDTRFAKTCFGSSVGVWSAKTEHLPQFLIAYLAFLDFDLCSVNPQVVGSSPTGGAMKNDKFRQKLVVFQ